MLRSGCMISYRKIAFAQIRATGCALTPNKATNFPIRDRFAGS